MSSEEETGSPPEAESRARVIIAKMADGTEKMFVRPRDKSEEALREAADALYEFLVGQIQAAEEEPPREDG